MRDNLLPQLGEALRSRRRERKLTQAMLAARLGRSTPRICELERALLEGRTGKDRLTLLAQVCDALELTPLLVPRERAQALRRLLQGGPPSSAGVMPGRVFDDVFVDLSDEDNGDADEER